MTLLTITRVTIQADNGTVFECFGQDDHAAIFDAQCRLSEEAEKLLGEDAPDEVLSKYVLDHMLKARIHRIPVRGSVFEGASVANRPN